jgi:LPXTG-motif cell wall-anchored protein
LKSLSVSTKLNLGTQFGEEGNWGTGMRKLVAIVALAGLLVLSGAALAQTPAQDQYGDEPPAAGTTTESTQVKPGVFAPPAAEDGSDGLLPFTGAQLILPAALGATMLGLGLFVVYRTRRRGS